MVFAANKSIIWESSDDSLSQTSQRSVCFSSSGSDEAGAYEDQEYDSLESAAQELIDAVKAEDVKGAAMALRSAFELMGSEPHQEGEHI